MPIRLRRATGGYARYVEHGTGRFGHGVLVPRLPDEGGVEGDAWTRFLLAYLGWRWLDACGGPGVLCPVTWPG